MVTRAQLIRRTVVKAYGNDKPSWYLQEDFWDFMLNVLGIAADVLRFADKPIAATTVERVVHVAQRKAITLRQPDMQAALRMKLQILSKQFQASSKPLDPLLQAKLDAQVELITELLRGSGRTEREEG